MNWKEIFQVDLARKIITFLPEFVSGLLVLLIFWLVAKGIASLVRRVSESRGVEQELSRFLASITKTTILVFGVVTALGTMGVDVGGLVAGLGLTGFALGFALKDIVSNLLAGILILLYKPFDYDDKIKVSSYEGVVERIDLRYTLLKSTADQLVYVPNSMLFTNAVIVIDERHLESNSGNDQTGPA